MKPGSLIRTGAVTLAAFLAVPLMPASAATVDITLLLVNDIYKMSGDDDRGGFARLAAVARAEREKGGNVLYVHAGDTISPSLMAGFDQGAHVIDLLNVVPPDIFVPGNHEYDFGPEVFGKRLAESTFPWYAANLLGPDGQPHPGVKGTEIRDIGGVKVGIVPLTADDAPVKSSPGNLSFKPTVETGVALANELREGGADIVVGVVHANREQDRALFDSRAFDVILTGDDHDLAVFYDGVVAMVESAEEGNYVTAVDLKVEVEEEDGRRSVSWHPNFRIMDTAGVTPDPETQAKVEKYEADLSAELDVAVGTTTSELDSRRATVRGGEAAIGNLIADAMRAAVGADIAITNGGGIRGNTTYAPGAQITRRDILTELPFGNRTVLLEISGQAILDALENGVSQIENAAGRFPQVSGITVTYDPAQPAGSRIVSVTKDGQPLDPAATYKLATNDYMAGGGDGYTAFESGKPLLGTRDAKLMANDVMAYLQKAGTVDAKVEGRVTTK